jgi:hypothetical protein
VVHIRIAQTALQGPASKSEPSSQRWVNLPTLVCMMLATVSFGAARIHAGAITHASHAAGAPAENTSVSIRLVDFKPHTFMPSAFADWTETAEK